MLSLKTKADSTVMKDVTSEGTLVRNFFWRSTCRGCGAQRGESKKEDGQMTIEQSFAKMAVKEAEKLRGAGDVEMEEGTAAAPAWPAPDAARASV